MSPSLGAVELSSSGYERAKVYWDQFLEVHGAIDPYVDGYMYEFPALDKLGADVWNILQYALEYLDPHYPLIAEWAANTMLRLDPLASLPLLVKKSGLQTTPPYFYLDLLIGTGLSEAFLKVEAATPNLEAWMRHLAGRNAYLPLHRVELEKILEQYLSPLPEKQILKKKLGEPLSSQELGSEMADAVLEGSPLRVGTLAQAISEGGDDLASVGLELLHRELGARANYLILYYFKMNTAQGSAAIRDSCIQILGQSPLVSVQVLDWMENYETKSALKAKIRNAIFRRSKGLASF